MKITDNKNKFIVIWKDKTITYRNTKNKIITISLKDKFNEWYKDGNVTFINGYYSTHDTQWKNKIKSKKDLFKYFIKEFINPIKNQFIPLYHEGDYFKN